MQNVLLYNRLMRIKPTLSRKGFDKHAALHAKLLNRLNEHPRIENSQSCIVDAPVLRYQGVSGALLVKSNDDKMMPPATMGK
jgi:hypothetical protein